MFKKINPYEVQVNVFNMIGKQKMLIVAGNKEGVNGMTASWGSMGVIWGAPACFAFVRDSRFTKTFMDAEETFSLCFFGEGYEEMYRYMGTVSGRDEDKTTHCDLTVAYEGDTPYYAEADTVIICRKQGAVRMPAETMSDAVNEKWYTSKDYHTMYTGIIECYMVK